MLCSTVWGDEGVLWLALHDAGLTPRERDIALLTLAGMTRRQISDFLSITPDTVRHVRNRIYAAFGLNDRPVAQGSAAIPLARQIWGASDGDS